MEPADDPAPACTTPRSECSIPACLKRIGAPPSFLRGGIAVAENEPGVRRLAEIPMFLPGDTSGRDSRAALLAPSGSVHRFRRRRAAETPSCAPRAGYAILPDDIGRVVRFRARVEPVVLRNGEPSEVAYVGPVILASRRAREVADGWRLAAADGGPLAVGGTAGRAGAAGRRGAPRRRRGRPASPVWAGWAAPEIVEVDTRQDGFDLLWISLDTLRADRLGTYGYTRRPTSPHLDRLAEGGVVFDTAVEPGAVDPAVAPLHVHRQLPVVEPRLLPIGSWRTRFGAPAGAPARSPAAARWMHVWASMTASKPTGCSTGTKISTPSRAGTRLSSGRRTFLFLHTFAIHDPYTDHRFARAESLPPGRIGERFGRDEWDGWERRLTGDEQAYVDALYDGGIAALDEVLGRLFHWLETSGRLDHTLVVVTSDHGEHLFEHGSWRHGSTMYDHQILVPAILHLPPVLRDRLGESPTRIADQVQLVDLYPTVLELLGLPLDHEVQGRSLVPLLRGETLEPRLAFSENVNIDVYERKAFRTKRWKLVWQTPKGSSAARAEERVTLYDLTRDPLERNDISHQHPDAVTRHIALMQQLIQDAGALEEEVPEDLPEDLRERLRALGYID